MWIFPIDETSIDDWFKVCSYQPPVGMTKIEDKEKIVIIQTDDLLKITKELNGERPLPSIESSNDILGDIEPCDIDENVQFEYFESCTIEEVYKGVTDTRGIWNKQSINLLRMHTKTEMGTEITRFEGRKGYPSIIWG